MASRSTTHTAPSDLGPEARALWRRTFAEYAFDAATDVALLGEMCRCLDRLRQVQAAIREGGLTVTGSQGQSRLNPLLTHEDTLRRTILAHARALRLGSTLEI